MDQKMEQPSTQITSESPVEASSESSQPKSGSLKTPTIIAAIASVFAIAGIAAGVYFFIDSNNKSTEISNLNAKITTLNSQINSNQPTTTPDSINEGQTDNPATLPNAKKYGFTVSNLIGERSEANISTTTAFGAKFSLYANGTITMSIDGEACNYYNESCISHRFDKDITSLIPGKAVDISSKQFGNGGTSWVFFVLEDGSVASIWEFDALNGQPATIIDNSENIFRIVGSSFVQDNLGKIHAILPHTNDDGEILFTVE